MYTKLPIFDQMDDCRTHADIAAFMKRVPVSVLMTCQSAFRNRCHNRHFPKGIEYVDLTMAALRTVRNADGTFSDAAIEGFRIANGLMDAVIAEEGGVT